MVRSPAPSSSMDGEHPAPSFAKGAQAMTDINNSVEPIRPSLPGISNTVKAISASLALL